MLLTRAPLTLRSVRLACVRPAASVRSEPGSNSQVTVVSSKTDPENRSSYPISKIPELAKLPSAHRPGIPSIPIQLVQEHPVDPTGTVEIKEATR